MRLLTGVSRIAAHKTMPRYAIRRSRESTRKRRPAARLPHLFGRGGRDRALIALAVNGALHVRHLARLIGSDSHKTWNMVERLLQSRIVVKRTREGGRQYVQINQGLHAQRALMRLLLAMDRIWPAKRAARKVKRWHMPFSSTMTDKHREEIFHSRVRSRVLLYVQAVKRTNMIDMYHALRMNSVTALYVVNFWEREGVLRTYALGVHRIVELNPEFAVAKELRAFLEALVQQSRRYLWHRELGRKRARQYRPGKGRRGA